MFFDMTATKLTQCITCFLQWTVGDYENDSNEHDMTL